MTSTAQRSVKKTILVNSVANGAGLVVQIALTFVLTPLLVHGLGDRRYGVWSLVESVIAYLTLFDLGIAAAVVRFSARFEGVGDQDRLNRVATCSLALFAGAGSGVLLIAGGLLAAGWPWATVPADLAAQARSVLLLLALNLSLGLPLGVFPSLLDGLQRFVAKNVIRTAMRLVSAAVTVIVLRRGGGLVDLITAYLIVNLAEHGLMAGLCWLYLPALRLVPRLLDRETFRLIRGYSINAFLAMVAGRIAFQTDALVISLFLAPDYIAYFVVGARLVEYSKGLFSTVTGALTPAVSQLEARGSNEGIRRILLDGSRLGTWLLAPVAAGLIALGQPFLSLWVGPTYGEKSYPVMVILALPLALFGAQSVAGRILYGLGRLRQFTRAALIQALVNLALSILFARPLGIEGVALGTAIPFLIFCLWNVLNISRECDVRTVDALRSIFVRPLAAALLLGLGWRLPVEIGAIGSYPALFLATALGLFCYALAALLLEFGCKGLLQGMRTVRGMSLSSSHVQRI
jgi:O-antigen/teichoic acid export membrane protein